MGGQRRAPIGVIVNPAAGRGQAVRAAEALLAHARAAGEPLLVRRSSGPGAASRLARALAPQVRALCAVGGDGTLHEVANGLLPLEPARRPPLTPLPVGSGNDLARALALRPGARAALARLTAGRPHAIDVLRTDDEWGLNNAAVGFGAEVVHDMARARTGRHLALPGALAYAVFALRRLRTASPPVSITADGRRCATGRFFEIHIANGPYCGAGVSFAPGARPDDGRAELVWLPPRGLAATIAALLRARRALAPDLSGGGGHVRARRIEIRSEQPLRWYIDGEPRSAPGPAQLVFVLEPAALPLLLDPAPSPSAPRHTTAGSSVRDLQSARL